MARNPLKQKPSSIDRLPPHSMEAEQGVLGCVLLSPKESMSVCRQHINGSGNIFYDLRHQTIYSTMEEMFDQHKAIDVITLQQRLKDRQLLEQVGGIMYLSHLPDFAPSSSNISYYLDIVVEKWKIRRMIHAFTDTVSRVYDFEGNIDQLFSRTKQELSKIFTHKGTTQQHWSVRDLMDYNPDADPNAVIGLHDGKTTRYLCKGAGAWLIGQSGIGKSSLGIQQGFTWALGRPFLGIHPVKPLRVLIVQNENDQGDCSEATQGVVECLCKDPAELDMVNERVKIIRCRGKTGKDFCFWLEQEIFEWRADLVYVDPLLRYAGIDVSRQDQCTRFLNEQLDPLLASTEVVLIGAHHTGKPKSSKETAGWTIYDYAYSGIGSSELVNWARAISILRVLNGDEGTFDLLLSKRGPRAWASHPNGDFATTIYLRHAPRGIFWQQIDPSELQQKSPSDSKKSTTKPSKIQEIISSNLFSFCASCKSEGEGLREIARRLENFFSAQQLDYSTATCLRAISALVGTGKLTKNPDSKYIKGPNA